MIRDIAPLRLYLLIIVQKILVRYPEKKCHFRLRGIKLNLYLEITLIIIIKAITSQLLQTQKI